jgi:hypothetical protein
MFRAMDEPLARIEAEWIDRVDRITVDVTVGLPGRIDKRVDAGELPRLRVVVAVDEVASVRYYGARVSL